MTAFSVPPKPLLDSPSPRIRDLLDQATHRLRLARVPEAEVKSQWALAHLLDLSRTELITRGGEEVPPDRAERFQQWMARLARHEPLQYVLGDTEFFGRRLRCDRRALIPRPETEQLVSTVLADPFLRRRPRPRIADVGTGTGCVALTLALELPRARLWATDTNPRALSLARRNARLLHVGKRVRFFRTDLLTGLSAHSLDAVVSNPPYVRTTDWPELERQILRFEPRSAFDGGPDGLNPIRRLIRQARSALRQNGLFFLEIGEDQGPAARKILRREGFRNIVCHRDLQGHPRILAARRGADAAHC